MNNKELHNFKVEFKSLFEAYRKDNELVEELDSKLNKLSKVQINRAKALSKILASNAVPQEGVISLNDSELYRYSMNSSNKGDIYNANEIVTEFYPITLVNPESDNHD